MICVSVMLAIFLGWPLAFGGRGSDGIETQVGEARAVAAAPAPRQPELIQASAVTGPVAGTRPESCYHRYRREVKQCSDTGGTGAVCRLSAADHWDMCEATGFWPE